jgi:hypothetical protein
MDPQKPENRAMDKPFQRKGASSNSQVGLDFEVIAKQFFATTGLHLESKTAVNVGVNGTKEHKFDLGCNKQRVLVECKSSTWTESDNVPSAKMTDWNQAMYFFLAAPSGYRKIFFVLRHYSARRKETLAEYYLRTNHHLIPEDVEFWEYCNLKRTAKRIR